MQKMYQKSANPMDIHAPQHVIQSALQQIHSAQRHSHSTLEQPANQSAWPA